MTMVEGCSVLPNAVAYAAMDVALNVEPPDPVFDHGSIVLGTDGCGMYWHLIVTGEHRGQVWSIGGVGAQPFGAQLGHTSGQPGFAGRVRHRHEGKDWFDLL